MNVPQLRFKGFAGEWEEKIVKDAFSEVRNGFVGTATPYYTEAGIPYLQSNNVKNNKINTKKLICINEEFHNKNKKSILRENDIVMVQSGHAGECAVIGKEFDGANCHALIVMTPKSKTNSSFFSYYINSPLGQRKLYKLITGNTIRHILASDIKKYEIKMPQEEEQEKISIFLSLLERRIEKQQEKIEKLEQFKKGKMQKIFSQELRFKDEDGGEFPEWELKELKDIANIIGGGTPSTSNEDYWNGNIPWFTPTEISNEKYVNQSKRTISEEGLKKSSAKVLPAGTILLTTRATLGDMAIATVPVTTNQGFQSIFPKENSVSEFIYYLQPQIKKHCLVNASGSTFMEISKSNLETFTTLIPSKKEQIKISSYLSALDLKIEKEKEKLMVLEERKRGFMQGMFV